MNSLIKQSQNNSTALFKLLRSGISSSDAVSTQNQVNQIAQNASGVLSSARKQSVPSPAKEAQTNLVQALTLRYDGLISIAKQIQPAVGSAVSQSAVSTIAGDMARFYSSDVLYKLYTVPELAEALHGAGAVVGGADGVQINGDQFLPSLSWLTPTYISTTLGVPAGSASGSGSSAAGPLPHGSKLNTVSFNGAQLQTSGNTVPGKPAPTFTLNFTDSGASTETQRRLQGDGRKGQRPEGRAGGRRRRLDQLLGDAVELAAGWVGDLDGDDREGPRRDQHQ